MAEAKLNTPQNPVVISFKNATFKRNRHHVFEDFNWEIRKNESWGIAGKSGTGKTSLLLALRGKYLLVKGEVWNTLGGCLETGLNELGKHAAFVFFQDQELNYNSFYYQQRYNSTEAEGTVTVRKFLEDDVSNISGIFNLKDLLDQEFIKLSNGETRKVLLAKALKKNPRLLILDNPFTGLDADAREMLKDLISYLIHGGTQVIMTADREDFPEGISRTLQMEEICKPEKGITGIPFLENFDFCHQDDHSSYKIAVQLKNVVVRYGDHSVVNQVEWTILKNEKWVLTGKNGAGKSMLLSLIFADNPQAYANEILLFDKPRGQGESIWDIKEKIGFLSPEVHFYCDKRLTGEETALKEIYSNPYRKTVISGNQIQMMRFLFNYYGIAHLSDIPLSNMSTGQQRLMLFIGVLMKDPPLLLLDEPFQCFDGEMIEKSKRLLDRYCSHKTLIFVSHCEREIPSCINRFAVLENGKLFK